MLETKRVAAYGKRSTRIVYVSGDTRPSHGSPFTIHHPSRENTISTSPVSARKVLRRGRKVNGLSTSPRGSPKSGNIFGLASKKLPGDHAEPTPKRRPLGLKNVALPASPSIVYLGQRPAQTPNAKQKKFAPFKDSDVVIIEDDIAGRSRKVRKYGTRWSRAPDKLSMEGEVAPPPHRRALQRPIVVSDDEDEDEVDDTPKRPTRGARTNPIVLSDDSSDDYPEIPPIKLVRGASLARQNKQPTKTTLEGPQPLPKLISRPTQVEVSIPVRPLHLAPKPSRGHGIFLLNKPALKSFLTRSRSPRRSQRNAPQKKTRIPQLSSTFDLERSFADLSISADVDSKLAQPRMPPGPSSAKLSPSQYLLPLLTECGQSEPHCFDTFVATFPLDDLHDRTSTPLAFHKIGEASYSEVFAIGDVVIKIVPLRDESNADEQSSSDDIDLPQESDAKDVLQEMIVTRTMGQICPGFIKLLRYGRSCWWISCFLAVSMG